MYGTGRGVAQDDLQAFMWFRVAENHSEKTATAAAESRKLIEARMTREQIAEGRRLAREWMKRHSLGYID